MAARASASRGDRVPPAGHRAGSARPGGPVPDGDAGACWPAAPWSRPRPRPATASAGPACGETVGCRPREVRAKCARASSFHARARSGHILEILSRCGRAVKRIPADSRHRADGPAAFRTESAAHELVSPLRWCPRGTTRRSWRVTSVVRCAVTQSHRPRHRTEGHAQALIARACRSACNVCGGARRQQRRSKRIPLHENRNRVS